MRVVVIEEAISNDRSNHLLTNDLVFAQSNLLSKVALLLILNEAVLHKGKERLLAYLRLWLLMTRIIRQCTVDFCQPEFIYTQTNRTTNTPTYT